jgi:hypothetical protein
MTDTTRHQSWQSTSSPPPHHIMLDIMLDPSLQEHFKTKVIQQEHHKTEYHLCEVMAGISFCKLNTYQPFYFSFI